MKKSIICACLLFVFSGVFAQNYYVAKSGNDDNSGTLAEPWLTIQNGLDQLAPGDILHIMEGTYNEKLFIEASGTQGNTIQIKNYNNDEVIVSGQGITNSEAIIEIYNVSYISIEGLILANSEMPDAKGILIDGNCDNITILDNEIYNINFSVNAGDQVSEETNAQPIIVFGSDDTDPIENLVIDGNEIYNSRTGYSEALALNGNVEDFEVINNYIHDISNIGIDIIGHEGTCAVAENDQARNGLVQNNVVYNCISAYATSGGIYVDGGKYLIIENNTSYHNGYGIEIGCENIGKTTSSIIVRNNVFYDNEICAMAIGGFDYPSGSGKVVDCKVLNNTCLKNDFSEGGAGEIYLSYLENAIIENNIFFLSSQDIFAYAESSQINLLMDYNLFYSESGNFDVSWNGTDYSSFANFASGTGLNSNSQFANPLLVSASISSANVHLQNGSPAINAGNPIFIADEGETDIDGDARVINNRVDIGADESKYDVGIRSKTAINKLVLYPNPSDDVIGIFFDSELDTYLLPYEIINCQGQIVIQHNLTNNLINIKNLNAGVYLLLINDNQGNVLYKSQFIKN